MPRNPRKAVRAKAMLGYIRGHWRIENSCHWVLDAIYREDHNQTRDRNAAANQSENPAMNQATYEISFEL